MLLPWHVYDYNGTCVSSLSTSRLAADLPLGTCHMQGPTRQPTQVPTVNPTLVGARDAVHTICRLSCTGHHTMRCVGHVVCDAASAANGTNGGTDSCPDDVAGESTVVLKNIQCMPIRLVDVVYAYTPG